MQRSDELLRRLIDRGVEFVVVGGLAAIAHGSQRMTQDLDIVAAFTEDNLRRLMAALAEVHPRNAARPDLGEIQATPVELARFRNLYLRTDIGHLDVLGELPPLGGYADAVHTSIQVPIFGRSCPILGLDALIQVKESLDRSKDREVAAELRAIRDRIRGHKPR